MKNHKFSNKITVMANVRASDGSLQKCKVPLINIPHLISLSLIKVLNKP